MGLLNNKNKKNLDLREQAKIAKKSEERMMDSMTSEINVIQEELEEIEQTQSSLNVVKDEFELKKEELDEVLNNALSTREIPTIIAESIDEKKKN